MRKWLKSVIGLLILGFLLCYLWSRRDQMTGLFNFQSYQILSLYLLVTFDTLNTARMVQVLVGRFQSRIKLVRMAVLQSSVMLLNYVPMKFGTVFQAHHLKTFYGLSYSGSVAIFAYRMFITALITGLFGFVTLCVGYGVASYEAAVLAVVFGLLFVVSLIGLFFPVSIPGSSNRFLAKLQYLFDQKNRLSRQKGLFVTCIVHLSVGFGITSCRFLVIYKSLGYDLSFVEGLFLGTVGAGAVLLGLTPGGLGLRELLLSAVSTLLDIPMEIGVLAAMLDRAVLFSWEFTVGGVSALWLWNKDSTDFKKAKEEPSCLGGVSEKSMENS